MQKREHIVSYTADELRAIRARGEDLSDYARLDAMTEEELEASIDYEEEGAFDLDHAISEDSLPKEQLTVRFDGDIVRWFKEQGPGYQTRMNAVLRSYVEAEKRKAITEARTNR